MAKTFLDAVNETDELATIDDTYGIKILNFLAFWKVLLTRPVKEIYTNLLLTFMKTLGTNKSGGRNGISRLQYFLNAFSQEFSLFLANVARLTFIGDDHFFLVRGGTGTNDPDFLFTSRAGKQYTLEAKMYYNQASYLKNVAITNFHKADYCIAYIIDTKQWYFSKKSEGYTKLYTPNTLFSTDPWLSEIVLPTEVSTVQFSTPEAKLGDLFDDQVLPLVTYTTYLNKQYINKY